MSARRAKPTALKERTSVRPSLGLSRLFAEANDIVKDDEEVGHAHKVSTLHKNTPAVLEVEDRTLKLDDPRLQAKVDHEDYGTAVRVPNREKKPLLDLDATKTMKIASVDTIATVNTSAVPQRTSVAKIQQKNEKKSEENRKRAALFLLIPALALFTYALLSPSGASHAHAPKSALSDTEIKEHLQYYQTTLGQRLNRQRIGVEMDNFRQAPALTGADHKVKPPSMLDGVPLQGEANNFQRPKDLPYDPTYSEAKTAYGLQEEQERRKFEQQAEREWVKEFIENARKDGYDVQIDQYGRVKAKQMAPDELPPADLAPNGAFDQGQSSGMQ